MFACMYSHRECYNSAHNQKVLDDLIQEVKTLNDTFEVAQIKGIAIAFIFYTPISMLGLLACIWLYV